MEPVDKRHKKGEEITTASKKLLRIKSPSENTIYRGFLDGSSDCNDSSDSSVNINNLRLSDDSYDSGNFAGEDRIRIPPPPPSRNHARVLRDNRPGTSGEIPSKERRSLEQQLNQAKAEELIREAERLKADIACLSSKLIAHMSNMTLVVAMMPSFNLSRMLTNN